MSNLIALLLHFMAANNVLEIILPQKSIRYIWTKVNTDTSLAWRPAILWLRVRPQQLTHQSYYMQRRPEVCTPKQLQLINY